MTNFLEWRRMRWGFVLWGGYILLWMVSVGSGVVIAILWWLTGVVVFGSLWLATQPPFRRGRSRNGGFVRPGWTDWRFLAVRPTRRPRPPTGRTLSSTSEALQPSEYGAHERIRGGVGP